MGKTQVYRIWPLLKCDHPSERTGTEISEFCGWAFRDEPAQPTTTVRGGGLAPGLPSPPQVAVFCSVNPISWQRLMGLLLRVICILIKNCEAQKQSVAFSVIRVLGVEF